MVSTMPLKGCIGIRCEGTGGGAATTSSLETLSVLIKP